MRYKLSSDNWLTLFFCIFALLVIFVWVPLDTGTGLVEKVRRQLVIGDALAPTLSGIVIFLGALLTLPNSSSNEFLSRRNWLWMLSLFFVFFVSIVLMRYSGPLMTSWVDIDYRPLRATPPWHYIGFLVGGSLMIGGLTSLVARRLSLRNFLIGFVSSLIIALLYDIPFDDLVLPPNGDV